MARVWQPLINPEHRGTRSRSTMKTVVSQDQAVWGQRPMFSEPGENQPPPETGRMMSEIQIDSVTPSDGRQGSEGVAEVRKGEAIIPVAFPETIYNVGNPPTDEEIRFAMGRVMNIGNSFIIRDGTGAAKVWLIVRGGGDTYYHLGMTKAV